MSPYRENARDSLADLDEAELGILAKLIRCLVRSDGELSGSERDQIEKIASDTGNEGFWKLLDAAAANPQDESALVKEAAAVGIKDAQELIYGTLYELSIVDASGEGENELLAQLASSWDLVVEDVKDDEPEG